VRYQLKQKSILEKPMAISCKKKCNLDCNKLSPTQALVQLCQEQYATIERNKAHHKQHHILVFAQDDEY